MSRLEILGTPFEISGVTIKNRYAFSPVTTATQWDDKGNITPRFIRYMEDRAKGGFGLLVTGAMSTDGVVDPYAATGPVITNAPEAFKESSKQLLDAVHAHGAKMFAQLTMGLGRNYPALPSPSENIVFGTESDMAPELTVEQIHAKVNALIEASKLVKEAGWDGIEVHAMHWGYLLDQFAMKCFNRREDEYGGTWENRLRAAREIVEGIKEACGQDYPVGMRFSLETFVKGANQGLLTAEGEQGRTLEESILCAKLLESYGYDYLSVDTGVYDSFWYACSPMYVPQSFMFDLAAKCTEAVHIPVICGGRMNDARACAEAIEAGKFDAVTLGRPGIADPEYPNKAIAGELDRIRPCIACNAGCFKKVCMDTQPMTCAVNPIAANEIELDLKPGEGEKTIAVIGGGVGGMEAARTAARRGYNVTLMEKSDHLGGHLVEAGAHSFKKEVRQLNEWFKRELKELGVNVVLNKEVTAEDMKNCPADAVILATGSVTAVPKIPGIEQTMTALYAINHPEEIGQKVIIAGGGLVGCEIAYDEVLKGKDVTVVEALDKIMAAGGAAPLPNLMMIQAEFADKGVHLLTNTKVTAFTENGACVEDKEGNSCELKADTVINALGFRPCNPLEEAVKEAGKPVCVIGDATGAANILKAIAEGYAAANNI
ncbi:MAG: FAD-dependent oxidoreductase [Erysipelotrichaceae bacterium]|nr:FAD-dependent oxidoreductase [Erysipelotrichaceae bacterium]